MIHELGLVRRWPSTCFNKLMSSSFSLLPQQYLISLHNLDEMLLALSRLGPLPPSLVCLCPTHQQCEWLRSVWPSGCVQKNVIFLSAQQLCQARERRRHLQKYKASVWLLPFFEFFYKKSLYRELAETVPQIWALSWAMSWHQQRDWVKTAQFSQLSPVLCSKIPLLDRFSRIEEFIFHHWQKMRQEKASYSLALGKKHLLVYATEKDLRNWRLWAKRNEVSFSLGPFCPDSLLAVIHVKALRTLGPKEINKRPLLIGGSAWHTPEVRYAMGLTRLSRPNSSLLRCVHWAALAAHRQIRWL